MTKYVIHLKTRRKLSKSISLDVPSRTEAHVTA